MKKTMKLFPAIVAMLALMLTVSFTSCSDDDEPAEVTYSFGFSSMSASTPDFLQEMNKIEAAYKSALGVTASPFQKNGNVNSCDQEVKNACEKAYNTLSDEIWKGTYTFQVLNVNTGKTVYEVTFKANDENSLL